jgi:homoserine dehydrogenase
VPGVAPEVVRVGLIGFGTVGSGVVRILRENRESIAQRLGFRLELARLADLDVERDRGVSLEGVALTREWREVALAPDVDVVLELVGGTHVAREIVLGALGAGKAVVTANKALLAEHGAELFAAARAQRTELAFEASVAGTIPVLRALREGLCGDRIEALCGIVNGTSNYVLSEMESAGEPYELCLKRAQALGYAEADPSFDVDGTDSAHKLALLLGLAFGAQLPVADIPRRGIEQVTPLDMEYARQLGLRIKLLAVGRVRPDGALEARVEPMLIPEASALAQVRGALNAVAVRGAFSGPTLYCGAGAGSLPTAAAVVSDVMDLARARVSGSCGRVPPLGWSRLSPMRLCDPAQLQGEFYLRFTARERPGALATVAGVLARCGISIAAVYQPERHGARSVPIVLVTHSTQESALRVAMAQTERLEELCARTQVLRIEREI